MRKIDPNTIKAWFLLMLFSFQAFFPSVSFGLTGGPSQPEFSSFETAHTSDMVDLITGDFTYNLPVINVPSPEGGVSIPLSYHAGIELDEESSWVGLGWNINPGCINRSVSQFADDYSNKGIGVSITGPGGTGYVENNLVYKNYYDSQKGSGGTANLSALISVGWGSQKGTNVLGLKFQDGSVTFDAGDAAERISQGSLNAASYWNPLSGIGFAAVALTNIPYTKNQKSDSKMSIGHYTMEQQVEKKGFMGIGSKVSYKYYLDDNKTEKAYGSLYLGNVMADNNLVNNPMSSSFDSYSEHYVYNGSYHTVQAGNRPKFFYGGYKTYPALDMHMHNDGGLYGNQTYPTSIAYDSYFVNGEGVSGRIAPYRHEVGTLCNSTINNSNVFAYSLTHYLNNYKVPFYYQGEVANKYTHHVAQGTSLSSPGMGISFVNSPSPGAHIANFKIDDASIHSSTAPFYNGALRTEPNRTDNSLFNNKLVKGKFIEWFSNDDIISGTAASQGFIDVKNFSRSSLPGKGIGGFSITREDGNTYHYALPVYNNWNKTEFNAGSTNFKSDNQNPYAYEWLLTSITGPDYVDRGTNGFDGQDWGYWVSYEYGKFNPNYYWRDPYFGESPVSPGSTTTKFEIGSRQNYYLNKISTRSHTALFVKSVKSDSKGFHDGGTYQYASSALKLDDIYVLHNSSYETLIKSSASGGYGLTYVNPASNNSTIKNGDTYNEVLDNFDVAASALKQFITSSQISHVHFNYSYDLCKNTYNSFDLNSTGTPPSYSPYNLSTVSTSRKGKLTLTSVDFLAQNDFKALPSYYFDYGTSTTDNPDYNYLKSDDWGLYKSGPVTANSGHNAMQEGSQWSLKKIITPVGAEIEIAYERDKYAFVNGRSIFTDSKQKVPVVSYNSSNMTVNSDFGDLTKVLKPGDAGTIKLKAGTFSTTHNFVVGSVSANNFNYTSSTGLPTGWLISEAYVATRERFGGSIRVSEIKIKDENSNSYSTKYYYTADGLSTGLTSGVASFEPAYSRGQNADFSFYNLYDHPFTPVLYSVVAVANGRERSPGVFDYTDKTFYSFTTPTESMLSLSADAVNDQNYNIRQVNCNAFGGNCTSEYYYVKMYNFRLTDNTSQIGNINYIKTYNKDNHLLNNTQFSYWKGGYDFWNNKIGTFTEGSLLSEYTFSQNNATSYSYFKRLFRTTKVKNPSILWAVSNTKNGLNLSHTNEVYDFKTGAVTSKAVLYPTGDMYLTKSLLAHEKYPEMSSKVYNSTNKNMMAQLTATYDYLKDPYTTYYGRVLSASVYTWKKNHTYREHDGATNKFKNQSYSNAWLPFQTYSHNYFVMHDGTLKTEDFVDFSWTAASQNARWKKVNEVTLYDHYSKPVEVKDINNRTSSSKFGYNNSFLLGSGENTPHTAWCFSGAEDRMPENSNYFGGEVGGGVFQFASSSFAHTGNYCVKLNPGQFGFTFGGQAGTDFRRGETYRAQVWVHQSNANNGILYCDVRDASGNNLAWIQTSVSSPQTKLVGNWYLYTVEYKVPDLPSSVASIGFGTWFPNTLASGSVYLDDFKVMPVSSPVEGYVYNEKTQKLVAILDKENYATKFTYDDAGRLVRTDKETGAGFKKATETKYNYAK